MKILLTGANGQVGQALWPGLHHFGEVIPTTRTGQAVHGMGTVALDLQDAAGVARLLDTVQPDLIVNAAAYTAVDRAEEEAEKAWRINAEAVGQLAEYNARQGSRLIHFSTDYVFSGESDIPFSESDAVAPQSVYGASKAEGERLIRSAGGDYRIFRTAWVYSLTGQNFLKTMLRLGQQRDRIAVVDDQVGSPTAAADLARLVLLTLKQPAIGTFHATGAGQTTWCGFARRIFSHAQRLGIIKDKPEVVAISSEAYPTAARRPAYSVLDNSKLHTTFGLGLPHWHSGLQHTMQALTPAFVQELAALSLDNNKHTEQKGETNAC
jgi:dTDP-4-dehydrorhamnose reductase